MFGLIRIIYSSHLYQVSLNTNVYIYLTWENDLGVGDGGE